MNCCKGVVTAVRQCGGCVEVEVIGESPGTFPIDNSCFRMIRDCEGADWIGRPVEYRARKHAVPRYSRSARGCRRPGRSRCPPDALPPIQSYLSNPSPSVVELKHVGQATAEILRAQTAAKSNAYDTSTRS